MRACVVYKENEESMVAREQPTALISSLLANAFADRLLNNPAHNCLWDSSKKTYKKTSRKHFVEIN